MGGLAAFNAFVQEEGLGRERRERFGRLKTGRNVVYPMHTQMQLLIDASVVGAKRVYDFEWLAADPLFTHLAGGGVPSIDALYDDLHRFGPCENEELKNAFGIGKVSTSAFDANAAAFLIKLLAYNLLRRWVMAEIPTVVRWRASWIRRACICIPARLLRSGARWELRLAPRPLLN